jgi:transketolase
MKATAEKFDVAKTRELAKELRVDIIRMLEKAGSGHPGGSLSLIDLLVVLYWNFFSYDPKAPHSPTRDRFVLSKGHCIPAVYAVWAKLGYFPKDELWTLRKLGTRLQGHPDRTRLPFVEANTGSLGQGVSIAVGMALSGKLDKADHRIYCVTGDGEIQEGQAWEAFMSAPKFGLDNLTVIVDHNQVQQEGLVKNQMNIEPLADKFKAFNWDVQSINGHDYEQLHGALEKAQERKGKPHMIVSNTIKGKGVSWMELNPAWHGKAPNHEEAEKAIAEILKGGK